MMTKTIGIVSGKGGVGKTTLAVNLGASLAKYYRKRVALVDCNLTTAHVSLYLGMYHYPVTLNNVLRGERHIEDAMYMHESGMAVIPASISLGELEGVDILEIRDKIKSLVEKNDLVLLDSAPGLGRESLGALKASDEVIFVTNPNVLSLTDVIRCNEVCQELGIKSLGVVLNMVNRDKYDVHRKDVERITGMPVIASIPYHKNIRRSIALRSTLVTLNPRDKVSKEIIGLAAAITNEPYNRGSLFSRIKFW